MSTLDSLQMEDLNEEWQQIALIIGLGNTRKLLMEFSGCTIYVPKRDDIERERRNRRIRAEFNGYNFRTLARKYDLTEVTIRTIVADQVKPARNRPMDGQLSIL